MPPINGDHWSRHEKRERSIRPLNTVQIARETSSNFKRLKFGVSDACRHEPTKMASWWLKLYRAVLIPKSIADTSFTIAPASCPMACSARAVRPMPLRTRAAIRSEISSGWKCCHAPNSRRMCSDAGVSAISRPSKAGFWRSPRFCLSIRATRIPSEASDAAKLKPTGPAPATMTSKVGVSHEFIRGCEQSLQSEISANASSDGPPGGVLSRAAFHLHRDVIKSAIEPFVPAWG